MSSALPDAGTVGRRALGLVWNRAERRLRMPVRVLLALVVFAVLSLVAVAAGRTLVGRAPGAALASGATGIRVAGALLSAIVAVVAVAGAGVAFDRRRLGDFGFHLDRGWWLDCAFGAALGLGLQAAILAVGLALGWFRVVGVLAATGGSVAGLAAANLLLFVGVSLSEELLVRGYLLTNLAEGLADLGVPGLPDLGSLSGRVAVGVATLVTSALFGLLHASNPSASALSTGSIALAGVFLAAGYLLSGELAIPLGLHFGWNYAQGVVFGFPVSGLELGVALLRTRETGPDIATGGAFGPEAGLLGVGAILLGTAAVAWWVRARTGTLTLNPAVWTPDLRWRPRGADGTDVDGPAADGARADRAAADGAGADDRE